jgi:hypothetical protein
MLLRTRHGLLFDPVSNELDPSLFPYAEMYVDYNSRRMELGRLIGTNDFIWCIPATSTFKFYEVIKPVEWEIQVSNSRILGYVNDQEWFNYLDGRNSSLSGVYSRSSLSISDHSVLVSYPLTQNEIVKMTIFRFIKPNKAEILCERMF